MIEKELNQIKKTAFVQIDKAESRSDLEAIRVKYLGRKSFLSNFSSTLSKLEPSERPLAGKALNQTKRAIQAFIEEKKQAVSLGEEWIDFTFPASEISLGRKHPLSIVIEEMGRVFEKIGFQIEEGTEIEDEWHNFQALNIPLEHPSRDVFDTFYLDLESRDKYKYLLRSHTSPSQIRLMQKRKPPFAFVVPGRVYRPDSPDASHSFMFHQIEGFAVGNNITFAHLKGVLLAFVKEVFSKRAEIRLRPSFFPFTEPSAEVDVSCINCQGKGCQVCKRTGWLEVLGCGMIHPNVLRSCGINYKKYKGFAFGVGIERIAMLKYKIDDIRLFYENDVRFLEQFYEV
jgi:phenylalanyl-tRNA synthetase alpha chain